MKEKIGQVLGRLFLTVAAGVAVVFVVCVPYYAGGRMLSVLPTGKSAHILIWLAGATGIVGLLAGACILVAWGAWIIRGRIFDDE